MAVSEFVISHIGDIAEFCRNLIFTKILCYRVYFFSRQSLLHRDPSIFIRGICLLFRHVLADYVFDYAF